MPNKKTLLGSTRIKVENISSFDKSNFNALTAPLGALVPIKKQLLLPGSFELKLKISAQLPPLATDAFLRTHLKVEAFVVPMRLCYGGFMSWFAGTKLTSRAADNTVSYTRAKLPRVVVPSWAQAGVTRETAYDYYTQRFGSSTLFDYFNVKYPIIVDPDNANFGKIEANIFENSSDDDRALNIFPFLCYQLCYEHWYRNKLIEKQLFGPADSNTGYTVGGENFPFYGFSQIENVIPGINTLSFLGNGSIFDLRQRNYGYDYFTTALPSAQDGSPMSVDTSSGSFTIGALRMQNALQHFAEINQLAGPDYVQMCEARYGISPSDGVAQKPICVGSADFPMFTSGVEQTANNDAQQTQNPMAGIAARYGRAHAEGNDFVCEVNVKEPSYLMVIASLVPEANYNAGVSRDMTIFTQEGSLVDLPCAELEGTGFEPVYAYELTGDIEQHDKIFGFQPRFMWHKAGAQNEVHGLFAAGRSLASFIPQRDIAGRDPEISTSFLKVQPSDLDNVTAVKSAISEYGVMIDSFISLKVSEPLGESELPSLVDPASEHGHSVYLRRGGKGID